MTGVKNRVESRQVTIQITKELLVETHQQEVITIREIVVEVIQEQVDQDLEEQGTQEENLREDHQAEVREENLEAELNLVVERQKHHSNK